MEETSRRRAFPTRPRKLNCGGKGDPHRHRPLRGDLANETRVEGVAERKGVSDERMTEFRWLLEELRVSFFAQELRTPQPVSVKRLDKAWSQLL